MPATPLPEMVAVDHDTAPPAMPSPATTAVSYATQLTTKALRGHLFALSQYARRVSDVTQQDAAEPSPFHSVSEPPIALAEYVIGAAIKCRLDKVTVLLSFAYVGAYSRSVNRPPSILSVHRLCAAALYVAAKVLQPEQTTSHAFSAAVGLPVDELIDLGTDVLGKVTRDPSAAELDAVFIKLEAARAKTLRREIAAAVAEALDLSVPQLCPSPDRRRNGGDSSPFAGTPQPAAGVSTVANTSSLLLHVPPAEWGAGSAPPSTNASPLAWGGSSPMATSLAPGNSPSTLHLAGGGLGLVRLLREDQLLQQQFQFQASTSSGVGYYALPTFESEVHEDELLLPPIVSSPAAARVTPGGKSGGGASPGGRRLRPIHITSVLRSRN